MVHALVHFRFLSGKVESREVSTAATVASLLESLSVRGPLGEHMGRVGMLCLEVSTDVLWDCPGFGAHFRRKTIGRL
jgi:hypothetical protein